VTFELGSALILPRVVTRGQKDRRTNVIKLVEETLQRFVAAAPLSLAWSPQLRSVGSVQAERTAARTSSLWSEVKSLRVKTVVCLRLFGLFLPVKSRKIRVFFRYCNLFIKGHMRKSANSLFCTESGANVCWAVLFFCLFKTIGN